ncbi:MAG TPA: serine/threonine-protein kinase [Kofleriaceae bacterium]|nr:serine/threonine-protein kinase [Kofleriaceae bacterium]
MSRNPPEVDDYQLGDLLGRGGMGEVRMARHTSGRVVALKTVRRTLSRDPIVCRQFESEASLLQLIDHPNVVRAVDAGKSRSGEPFLAMARAYGTRLDEELADGEVIERDRVAAIATQLLEGLVAIHDAGVLHADLKTSNVLIDELDRVTIIDFGLARRRGEASELTLVAGTPAYMAAELLDNKPPTVASDIYATGVVLYELLAGSPPLPRDLPIMMLWSRRTHEAVEPPSQRAPDRGITRELDAIVLRALDRDPAARFGSARLLADVLAPALARWSDTLPAVDEVATREWPRTASPAHLAPTLPRVSIRTAEGQTPAQQVALALDAVGVRVAAHDPAGAMHIIELALAHIGGAPEAWRLELVLAALCDHTGQRDRAIEVARRAVAHANESADVTARTRTKLLLARLGGPRLARGSGSPKRSSPDE